ncbi:MAG: OadG family protein [Lachnospiraceae bacterium]|nr:OadG family protein [Lachnospiraceae bacterium]
MIPYIAAANDIRIGEALGNMVVGLGVVFLALLFLCGIISLFKFLGKAEKKAAPAAQAKPAVKAAAPAAPAAPKEDAVDGAVVAAILAAVAQKCGPGARVVSIEKSK